MTGPTVRPGLELDDGRVPDGTGLSQAEPQEGLGPSGFDPSRGFIVKRWAVTVRWASGALTTGTAIATTRGKALADTWRSDAFSGSKFGEFLRFARCRRDRVTPPRWGDEITVNGKAAFFIGNNRQYVQFVYPGGTFVLNAHPYDVLPVTYRPSTYRDRDSDGSPKGGDACGSVHDSAGPKDIAHD